MNEHLTEQQLIDHAFQLASEAATKQVQAHLDRCEVCREHLEKLRSKFAALDLLREEIGASPELLAATIQHAAESKRPAILALWRYPWLAAAAVLLLGASLLLVPNLERDRHGTSTGQRPTPQSDSLSKGSVTPIAEDSESLIAKGGPRGPMPPAAMRLTERSASGRSSFVAAEETGDKPPFAPASAIELVVLPRRENVQLTIYNGADLTLVRERRSLTLKKGWNWLQFMWAGTLIDPTSLTLEPKEHRDRVDVQQLVFPPRLRELGRWLIRSEVSGQVPFELTYLTSGLSWRAFYMGTLSQDEKTMHLAGHVRIDNRSGEDYENAQTRLIVGKVHLLEQIRELAQRQYAYDRPSAFGLGGGAGMMGGMGGGMDRPGFGGRGGMPARRQDLGESIEPKEIRKEGLSEYFLYTIEGTETIPDQWGKRLQSFEVGEVPVTSLYKYDRQRWGDETMRFVSFANDAEHHLGQTPIPDGTIRIYGQVDAEAHLSYVGAATIKYIPVGEDIELNLGPARLVKVESTVMETRTENHVFDANGNVAGWDMLRSVKTEVANARTVPVEIEITQGFDTANWEMASVDETVAYAKHDLTHARFKLRVPPRSKEMFTYIDKTYYGVREEVFVRKQQESNR